MDWYVKLQQLAFDLLTSSIISYLHLVLLQLIS